MVVLDTNVVSEVMRSAPNTSVLQWLDDLPSSEILLTSVTVAELRAGVAVLPAGRRRAAIAKQVEALVEETFAGYVLPFDVDSSAHYAEIIARRRKAGTPISIADAQIAAICNQHGATLATRNSRDFADTGIALINPWEPRSPE